MMAKIDDVELQKLLDKGLNKAQIAKHLMKKYVADGEARQQVRRGT